MNIDATAGLINNFHRQSSFLKNREKSLTVSLHNKQELKQFLVYGLKDPLICAWRVKLIRISMKENIGVVFAIYPMSVLIIAAYDENGKIYHGN